MTTSASGGTSASSLTGMSSGRLPGRVAVVTGAGQGLGEALAHRLAREGAHVAVADIVDDKAAVVAEAIAREHGVRTIRVHADVTDPQQTEAMIDVGDPSWSGLGDGYGILSGRELTVTVTSRRFPAPRSGRVLLPDASGAVSAAPEARVASATGRVSEIAALPPAMAKAV